MSELLTDVRIGAPACPNAAEVLEIVNPDLAQFRLREQVRTLFPGDDPPQWRTCDGTARVQRAIKYPYPRTSVPTFADLKPFFSSTTALRQTAAPESATAPDCRWSFTVAVPALTASTFHWNSA